MRRLLTDRRPLAMRLACLWTVLACGFVWQMSVMPTRTIWAQEDNQEEAAQQPAAEEAAAQPAGQPASDGQPSKNDDTVLEWFFGALGISYTIAFLALSFLFVALFVMCLLSARRDNVCPPDLIEGFESHLGANQYQEAYELARADESFLGQVLAAGLAKVSVGYPQAIEAMQEVAEEENMKLEHRLSYLGLIGTISPMVGLFGTVDGMIRSFQVIARGGSTPKPSELAQGISTALVTTLVGLAIAIPAIAAYNILRNWVAQLVLEVGIRSEELMGHFQEGRS